MGYRTNTFIFVLSCCLLHGFKIAPIKLLGIFFIHFQYDLGATASEASLAVGITVSCMFLYGPLGTLVYNRLNERKAMLVGTILSAIGFLMASVLPNIISVDVALGVIAAFGLGISNIATFSITGRSFKSKLSLVNNLVITSSAVIIFALAPVVQHWVESYGWRGAMLIMSGMLMQTIVLSLIVTRDFKNMNQKEDTINSAQMTYVNLAEDDRSNEMEIIAECNKGGVEGTKKKEKKSMCHCFSFPKLLKNWCFITYGFSVAFGVVAKSLNSIYTMRYAQSIGIEDSKAVWIISIQQFCILVFGPISGILTSFKADPNDVTSSEDSSDKIENDKETSSWTDSLVASVKSVTQIRRSYILTTLYGLFVIAALIPLFAENFIGFVIYAILAGICIGSISALPITVISDLFGTEDLPFALGFRSLICGIFLLVTPILIGTLIDIVGNFRPAQYVSSACAAVSCFLSLISQIGMDNKRKRQNENMGLDLDA